MLRPLRPKPSEKQRWGDLILHHDLLTAPGDSPSPTSSELSPHLRLRSFGRNVQPLDRLWLFCPLPCDSIQMTAHESIFGQAMMEELGHHGYRIGPGTLYPLLHGLKRGGLLRSELENVEGRSIPGRCPRERGLHFRGGILRGTAMSQMVISRRKHWPDSVELIQSFGTGEEQRTGSAFSALASVRSTAGLPVAIRHQ